MYKRQEHTILGPSTGNFGIGTAYVSKLLGLRAIVIMPDTMSKERYERIRRYGGELELTPGSESDVILTLEKTRELMKDPKNRALAQFELFPNYRFHRHVTGDVYKRQSLPSPTRTPRSIILSTGAQPTALPIFDSGLWITLVWLLCSKPISRSST